jgi:hypothetical protein
MGLITKGKIICAYASYEDRNSGRIIIVIRFPGEKDFYYLKSYKQGMRDKSNFCNTTKYTQKTLDKIQKLTIDYFDNGILPRNKCDRCKKRYVCFTD